MALWRALGINVFRRIISIQTFLLVKSPQSRGPNKHQRHFNCCRMVSRRANGVAARRVPAGRSSYDVKIGAIQGSRRIWWGAIFMAESGLLVWLVWALVCRLD